MRSTRDGSPHRLRRGARLCSARACKPLHAGPRPNQRTIKRSARKARERACACQRQATTAQSARATGAPTKGRWCIQHTMSLPQVQKRLLVSVSRAFDECILAGRHAFPPPVAIVHPKGGKRFPTPLCTRKPLARLLAEEFTRCRTSHPTRQKEVPVLLFSYGSCTSTRGERGTGREQ